MIFFDNVFTFELLNSGVTSDNQKYETVINLYDTIVPDESKWINRDRGAEFVLIKEKKGPYWTRLLKESTKYHWLRVDFNKWKDEDESDEEEAAAGGLGGAGGAGGVDFANMMRQMGGMGGMGGMGDMGGMPDFGDMGGMPPMEGGDEENDSDEEMPGLEEDASKP